jgi:citrate lyase subunit beta / citryl-CoA lyase
VTAESLSGPALLFCPADRPDRYLKALAAADSVILDLEDAVAAGNKETARAGLVGTPVDASRVIVRVNPADSPYYISDLAALRQTEYHTIMLAKTETRAQLDRLDAFDSELRVVALCETPLGVLNAPAIASAPNVAAVMWGAEDLIAAMGGRSSRREDGRYRDVALHARSAVLLAAAAHGKAAVDSVYLDIPDTGGLAAEARDAVASGFAYKACIHPSQAAVVRAAFQPGDAQVAWARKVLAAARDAAGVTGVIAVEGQMIDAPLLRQAEAILASVSESA